MKLIHFETNWVRMRGESRLLLLIPQRFEGLKLLFSDSYSSTPTHRQSHYHSGTLTQLCSYRLLLSSSFFFFLLWRLLHKLVVGEILSSSFGKINLWALPVYRNKNNNSSNNNNNNNNNNQTGVPRSQTVICPRSFLLHHRFSSEIIITMIII